MICMSMYAEQILVMIGEDMIVVQHTTIVGGIKITYLENIKNLRFPIVADCYRPFLF